MIVEMDRILKGMDYWNKREDQLEQAFRNSLQNDRSHLEDKLKYMESLRDAYKNQVLNGAEKSTMKTLRGQIDKLERRLYPNLIERLLRRVVRKVRKIIADKRTHSQTTSGTTITGADPSGSRQVNGASRNRQTQDNQLQNNDGTTQPIKNDQKNDLRMVNEYKRSLSEKNKLQPPGKKIKYRLR